MTNNNSTYKRLGDYIREVNIRNKDLSVTKLMGINIDKHFMPSVANVIGTDMTNYKVVANGQFACNLMHVGRDEKIPVALNTEDSIIVSPAYFVFEVCNETLLPEYLELSFRNPEFDRNAWFHTDADVRGGMDKDGMKDLLIPVPPIEEQRSIVSRYQAIQNRIENNKKTIAKLEEAAQALYRKMFVDGIDVENLPEGWRMGTLGDIYEFQYGKGNNNPSNGGQYPVYGGNGIIGGFDEFNSEDSPVIGHIGINCGSLFYEPQKHFVTYNGIICRSKTDYKYFNYGSLLKSDLQSQVRGSSQPFISYDMLYEINVVLPTENLQAKYNQRAVDLFGMSILFQKENELLMEMLSMVMA